MRKPKRWSPGPPVLLDGVVLTGPIGPEGAPPFARRVNVLFPSPGLPCFVAVLVGRRVGDS